MPARPSCYYATLKVVTSSHPGGALDEAPRVLCGMKLEGELQRAAICRRLRTTGMESELLNDECPFAGSEKRTLRPLWMPQVGRDVT